MTATLGPKSTAAEVAHAFAEQARGRTFFITGGNVGLGFEAARVLASVGGKVIVACRSQSRADEAAEALRAAVPGADVSGWHVDLSDLNSVVERGAAFVATGRPIDVLINNAGIMAPPFAVTADGLESQFGVNHMGHFALTNALLPALRTAAAATQGGAGVRIVNLSSKASYLLAPDEGLPSSGAPLRTAESGRSYNAWTRYGVSKLANILHAAELQARLAGEGITAVSLHPGIIMGTSLTRSLGLGVAWDTLAAMPTSGSRMLNGILWNGETGKSIPQGAATTVFCALAPGVVGGAYYSDCAPAPAGLTHPRVGDAALAARLWDESEATLVEALARARQAK